MTEQPVQHPARRVGLKLLARPQERAVDLSAVLELFHGWIQRGALASTEPLLIDVVDYRHLQTGPKVMLVAHRGHYALDDSGGELGLLYQAKRDEPEQFERRLQHALVSLLEAAALLQEEASLVWRGDALRVRLSDRLHAPNSEQTHGRVEAALARLGAQLFGDGVKIRRANTDDRCCYEAELTAGAELPLPTLLERARAL